MKKTLYTLGLICMMSSFSFAQVDFGYKWDIGFSSVHEKRSFYSTSPIIGKGMNSNLGVFLNVPIVENVFLGSELTVGFIQGRTSSNGAIRNESDYIKTQTKTITNLYYLNLPIMAGIKLRKIQIKGGIQGSFNFNAIEKIKSYKEGDLENKTKQKIGSDISNFSYSSRFGIDFSCSRRVSISLNTHSSFNKVAKRRKFFDWRLQQITIGALYSIGEDKRKKPSQFR